jgi:hypothetical protein
MSDPLKRFETRHGKTFEVETLSSKTEPKRQNRLVGCPLEWLKRVIPIVESKGQLAFTIWLHRRRIVYGQEWFTVPNHELEEELGVSRFAKSRALRLLEAAGAIAVIRKGKSAALVKLLW